MKMITGLCSKLKYELIAIAAFSTIFLINVNTSSWQNAWIIALQLIAAALFAAGFIKRFPDENKNAASFFAALFALYLMVAYHYSMFSLSTVDMKHSIGLLIYLVSFICLLDERFAALVLPLGIAGVIISKDYAILSLPSLIVASAYTGDGFFALLKKEQKTKKNIKKKRNEPKAKFSALIGFNKFIAPALLAAAVITGIAYVLKGDQGYGLFLADWGYVLYIYKDMHLIIPCFFVVILFWWKTIKNKLMLAAFISALAAFMVTILGSFLFDFTLVLYRFYLMNAVVGIFAGTMIIAARSKEQEGSLKETISTIDARRVFAVIVVTLIYLSLASANIVK